MKATEAAALLTIAASFDNRKPDADQAKAWSMALDGLRFVDCREVIVAHYQRSREWLMPVDVIGGVKRMRAKRISDYGPIPSPDHLDHDSPTFNADYARYMHEFTQAIGDGNPPQPPAPAAIETNRDVVGELGQAGNSLEVAEMMRQVRARNDAARQKIADREAASRKRRDDRQAELKAMRAADRAARETRANPAAREALTDTSTTEESK